MIADIRQNIAVTRGISLPWVTFDPENESFLSF
jgi:hypothetical protein